MTALFAIGLSACGPDDTAVPCSPVTINLRSSRPEATRSALTITSSATWTSGEVALRAPDTKDFPSAVCVPTGETFVFTAQDVGRDVSRTTEAVADGEPITCTAYLLAPDAGTLLRVECASEVGQMTSALQDVMCPTSDPYCDDGSGGGGGDEPPTCVEPSGCPGWCVYVNANACMTEYYSGYTVRSYCEASGGDPCAAVLQYYVNTSGTCFGMDRLVGESISSCGSPLNGPL